MHHNAQHPLRPCLIATLVTLSVFAGCAQPPAIQNNQTDSQACDALKKLIHEAKTDFNALKVGEGVADYDHVRWDAKDVFPGAECDVIRWGAGKTNYACTWIKTDTKEARKDFSWGADKAEGCLGPSWVKSRLPGVTGLGDRFSTAGNPTVVDIRILRELTDSKTWQTSLTVGPAVNRDGK